MADTFNDDSIDGNPRIKGGEFNEKPLTSDDYCRASGLTDLALESDKVKSDMKE